MEISKYRALVAEQVDRVFLDDPCEWTGDSFFKRQGDLIAGVVRVKDKYSHVFQEFNYWLCVGHAFVTVLEKRERALTDSTWHYPFHIPWDSAQSISIRNLAYVPMSWQSYKPRVIKYGPATSAELVPVLRDTAEALRYVFENLKGLSPLAALDKIRATNGDVWIGKQYIVSYESHLAAS